MRHINQIAYGLALVACLGLLAGCDEAGDGNALQKVNGSVHVHSGTAPSDAETVNGSIEIDDNAAVGGAMTVNGGIKVGSRATATNLHTVNGGIVVGSATRIAKNIESVNGSISLADDVIVAGPVTNVNGKISLQSAQLGGGITTVNGDILIYGASHVAGGIHVEKPGGVIRLGSSPPRIEIGPGATVQGELIFDREVRLYVSDKATIGPVTGATAIPFTGDTAPRD
jgi:DUF4097 and DUF4098 domain-containing protein YvlB